MIKYLIEKEFKQLFRNSFLPKLVVMFPCMVILVFPWAVNLEIKNINLTVADHDQSSLSQRLTQKIGASEYFNLVGTPASWSDAMRDIENGTADMILEIPPRFERDLVREGEAGVLVAANTVNGSKGGLGSSYASAMVAAYADELREESGTVDGAPGMAVSTQNLFNPHLNYKLFMIPGLMAMLLTMLCGFMPALNIVGEKEHGTIEQINVSPVSKFVFILAKLIPYWMIGFLVMTICLMLAGFIYGVVPVGSPFTIYSLAMLFVLVVSGLGLVISNYSETMQQAMFVMYFFVLIMLLMSGLFTPVNSMPEWARTVAMFNPLKYFIQGMRSVYLKGSLLSDLTPQFIALAVFAFFFNLWAVLSYRKNV